MTTDTERPWTSCATRLPAECLIVETKVDDDDGLRNEQRLKLVRGLWYFPDGSMYVYYKPTHWRPPA